MSSDTLFGVTVYLEYNLHSCIQSKDLILGVKIENEVPNKKPILKVLRKCYLCVTKTEITS